jgi:hypothetical protein
LRTLTIDFSEVRKNKVFDPAKNERISSGLNDSIVDTSAFIDRSASLDSADF